MKTEEVLIHKGEWLTDALNRQGYQNIPTNVILDKTLTGLGATHTELHSKRNSIIIEPNVPVILEKTEGHPEWLAVWEKCLENQVGKYLNSAYKEKKLICTPEGFSKIRNAANSLNVNIYQDYFCLMDECEKFIQDVDFRKRITQPIYDFFQFQQKAFVSATPLSMRHKELDNQKFRILKIVPDYDYKQPLNLIITERYDVRVIESLKSLKDSECICIFLNSTNGINKIINTLRLKDYKVFCSKESKDKLEQRDFENICEMLEPLVKYNFFTCRFFSALDIKLEVKPDVLMLTDLTEASYTMIDPLTEAIQIQGRFRNGVNSLTHISNIDRYQEVMNDEEIGAWIDEMEKHYIYLKDRLNATGENARIKAIKEDMKKLKYAEFLNERGETNYFMVDNYYNEERVKRYYLSEDSLLKAYESTNHFQITYNHPILFYFGDTHLLHARKAKTDAERWKMIAVSLDELFRNKDMVNVDVYLDIIKKEKDGEKIIKAFKKIGLKGFEEAQYNKKEIAKAVKAYDVEVHRFLPEVLNDVYTTFEEGSEIEDEKIVEKLTLIYKQHDIECKVNKSTINDYYLTSKPHKKGATKRTLKHPIYERGKNLTRGYIKQKK